MIEKYGYLEDTYWNNRGLYQELYNKFYKEIEIKNNRAITDNSELLRIASNIYYDYYQNECYDLYEITRIKNSTKHTKLSTHGVYYFKTLYNILPKEYHDIIDNIKQIILDTPNIALYAITIQEKFEEFMNIIILFIKK